ncbi:MULTISPECIES: DMT family transporter [unclassified Frankia]|uniref:DMT family transporter n=1 Tax=unclassified Frankia TaxID=2632575 RepID=UPI002023DE19
MAYVFLGLAIVTEVLGTSLIRSTDGFTRLWPTVGCLAAYGLAFVALAQAVEKGMRVGVGYAIWAGLGTALVVVIGIVGLNESVTVAKVLGVTLIIAGVIVLNLGGAH